MCGKWLIIYLFVLSAVDQRNSQSMALVRETARRVILHGTGDVRSTLRTLWFAAKWFRFAVKIGVGRSVCRLL